MDVTASNLSTLTPRIIICSTTSLVPLEKFLRDNKFLVNQITIHTKMPVCKFRVHAK